MQNNSAFLTLDHWILLFMDLSMIRQATRCCECSSARFTFEIAFAGVYSNVTEHIRFGCKHLITIRTCQKQNSLRTKENKFSKFQAICLHGTLGTSWISRCLSISVFRQNDLLQISQFMLRSPCRTNELVSHRIRLHTISISTIQSRFWLTVWIFKCLKYFARSWNLYGQWGHWCFLKEINLIHSVQPLTSQRQTYHLHGCVRGRINYFCAWIFYLKTEIILAAATSPLQNLSSLTAVIAFKFWHFMHVHVILKSNV